MENMDVEREDITVIIDKTIQNLSNCVGEHQNVTNKYPPIYMAPITLRNLSPNSFMPRVVSIGPLHRNDANLQRFEERKVDFVRGLLSRQEPLLTQPEQMLKVCVEKVASMKEEIKGCYEKVAFMREEIMGCYADMKSYEYGDTEITTMMVTDACFILEFIHKKLNLTKKSNLTNLSLQEQYVPYDLVLLENQIPFFVLKGIYECVKCKFEEPSLPISEFILPLLKYVNLFKGRKKVSSGIRSNTKHDHILSYLHCYYRPIKEIHSAFPSSTIHSVVELDRAGVRFKPKDDSDWPMAMEVKKNHSRIFWFLSKCTLTMPRLCIDDFTELVFRNLIAYEQSYVADPYVTSYARAMNMLIDTHEDIAKLVRSKVIVNHIGSNEEAANMINKICKEVVPKHFYYTKQWEILDRNFEGYWPKKVVKLKRTYFHSPWSVIALLAGIGLFVLALLQTIFTIKSS